MLKNQLKNLLFFCAFLLYGLNVESQKKQSQFKGYLKIDSIWEPTVYLSHIPSLSSMYTISNNMIIAQSKIDSLGYFSFNLDYISEEDQLYRIHISKKNDPPASLIIGGDEENHMFIVLNQNSSLEIKNEKGKKLFRNVQIKGSMATRSIVQINDLVSYKDSTDFGSSSIKKEFLNDAIDEKLRFVADTSSNSLVSLYALSKSNFILNYRLNEKFYINYLARWKNEKSSYFRSFREQIPKEEKSKDYSIFLWTIGAFVLGFSIHYMKRSKKSKLHKRIQTLSVQERKIFTLIQQGKSNKEISEEYNIELSTVKSHVSNIYAKLQIKSRKEALEIRF